MKNALTCRAASIAVLVFALPALAGVSTERLQRLDDYLERTVAAGAIPGAVLQVTHDGETVYHRAAGFRDREANAAMRPDTIFRIASMSKAVVSAAVLMLQERGALLVNQPVGDILPEFAETTVAATDEDGNVLLVDAERPITVRDLLTHTAGIGYGYGPAAEQWQAANLQHWYFGHRDEPIRETVRRMADLPMDAQPGEGGSSTATTRTSSARSWKWRVASHWTNSCKPKCSIHLAWSTRRSTCRHPRPRGWPSCTPPRRMAD